MRLFCAYRVLSTLLVQLQDMYHMHTGFISILNEKILWDLHMLAWLTHIDTSLCVRWTAPL